MSSHPRSWPQRWPRWNAQRRRLQALRDAGKICPERASWLEWRAGDADDALAAAQAVLNTTPDSALALHVRGAVRLSLGDAQGRDDLEACLRATKAWIGPCRAALDALPDAGMGPEERARNAVLLDRALARRHAAVQDLLQEFKSGRVDEAPLDATSRGILAQRVLQPQVLRAVWSVYTTEPLAPGLESALQSDARLRLVPQ